MSADAQNITGRVAHFGRNLKEEERLLSNRAWWLRSGHQKQLYANPITVVTKHGSFAHFFSVRNSREIKPIIVYQQIKSCMVAEMWLRKKHFVTLFHCPFPTHTFCYFWYFSLPSPIWQYQFSTIICLTKISTSNCPHFVVISNW